MTNPITKVISCWDALPSPESDADKHAAPACQPPAENAPDANVARSGGIQASGASALGAAPTADDVAPVSYLDRFPLARIAFCCTSCWEDTESCTCIVPGDGIVRGTQP